MRKRKMHNYYALYIFDRPYKVQNERVGSFEIRSTKCTLVLPPLLIHPYFALFIGYLITRF